METPASPVYSENSISFSSRATLSRKIDSTKLKTRTCRYVSAKLCPYGSNCAFVHTGEERQLRVLEPSSPSTGMTNNASFSSESRPRRGFSQLDVSLFEETHNYPSDAFESTPPPPSYNEVVQEDFGVVPTEYMCPPAYPTRYRHDPYSFTGVFFEE